MAYSGTQAQQDLWAKQCYASADYAHIPRDILWGVYGMESNFGRYIGTSSASATGLMQFIPSTAAQYHYPQTNYPDKNQSQDQFTAAALYLRTLFEHTRSWDIAIRDYSGTGYGLADVEAKAASHTVGSIGGSQSSTPYQQFAPTSSGITSVDDGIDMTVTSGLGALGKGKCVWRDDKEWLPYGPFMAFSLDDGPRKGWFYYVAEGILPVRHIGDSVNAGDVIAQRAAQGVNGVVGNIEAGWAGFRNHSQTLAQERGHGGERPSPEGEDFKGFYNGIPAGSSAGGAPGLSIRSADMISALTSYDWSGDMDQAGHEMEKEALNGYKVSQDARRFILSIKTFTTTGGR